MDEQYTQKIEELLQTGISQFDEKDFAKSLASFSEVYQLANNAKDWVNVSFAAAWLGCVYREQGDLVSAKSYFQERLNWAQALDDFKAKWQVLDWMDQVAEQEGKFADAIHYYQAQLILVPLYGIEKNFEVETADRIGYLYFSAQNYALAIDYLHRSAMLAKELSWDKWRANNYSMLANEAQILGERVKVPLVVASR